MTLDRREFVVGSALAMAAAACKGTANEPAASALPIAQSSTADPMDPQLVRIASVKTAVEGGLLPRLIESFTDYRVAVITGEDVYQRARAGSVDVVVSHYGHRDAEQFVLDGLGEWPRTVFSNQMALLGPPSDPAKIRGLDDAGQAFRRIAATRSPFVVNDLDGVRYLTEILWNAAGRPDRAGWMIDDEVSRGGAIERAAKLGGYTLWGLTPFLRTVGAHPVALEPLVLGDPLLQRMLVTIVVKPGPHAVNIDGARAFQTHLLAPATQAAIRTVSYPGASAVTWVPAGRHNRSAMLPKG